MARKKIKTIFEPFADYVQDQLNVRKAILSNPRKVEKIIPEDATQSPYWDVGKDFQLDSRSTPSISAEQQNATYGPENFYAYTTEKQCTIRMMSGVDLKDEVDPALLEIALDKATGKQREYDLATANNDEMYLNHAMGLAKQYILEGGTRYYNDGGNGIREGFTTGNFEDDTVRGFSYGDRSIRADAKDGFGVVPMPGIVDATIRTKSDNGSLREAQVNFICYNRRQLEILEMLYMRPGYPVCLEWGWNPYINNEFERVNNTFSIRGDFFNPNSNMNELNDRIRDYKIQSGGNYDGFIGYVKNFSFKAREDGGYECVTEIMAHGEILESLKSTRMSTKTGDKLPETEDPEVESIDRLLYYLRAIKYTLNNDGDAWYYKNQGTYYDVYGDGYIPKELQSNNTDTGPIDFFSNAGGFGRCTSNFGSCRLESETSQITGPGPNGCDTSPTSGIVCEHTGYCVYSGNSELNCSQYNYEYQLMTDSQGNPLYDITVNLNNNNNVSQNSNWDAGQGDEIAEKKEELANQGINSTQDQVESLNRVNLHYQEGFTEIVKLYLQIIKAEGLEAGGGDVNPLQGQGYQSLLGGTIIKQVVKYNPTIQGNVIYDTGYRKNIYIRWDLLCQMINHLSTHKKYSSASLRYPITELSYLHSNEETFNQRPVKKGKVKRGELMTNGKVYDGNSTYIRYRPPVMIDTDPDVTVWKDSTSTIEQSTLQLDLNNLFKSGKVHPLLGQSVDERVCLLPHMDIFKPLFDSMKYKEGENNETAESVNTNTKIDPSFEDGDDTKTENVGGEFTFLTSYKMGSYEQGIKSPDEALCMIGLIHFNLDFVLETYESLRLKHKITENSTIVLLSDDFNMLDFIKGLWEGVNAATANFYKFTLTTEHERPHVARIVDLRFNRDDDEGIYTFEPQGLRSVTRQFFFNSNISNDMASMISIAAQAPNNAQSLETLSFKAFHRNIKSRFTSQEQSDAEKTTDEKIAAENLKNDILEYQELCTSLSYYLFKLNAGNFETTEGDKVLLINPSEAAQSAQSILDLRYSILNRYPLEDENGNPNDGKDGRPNAGFWREGTTHENSAILPLQFNLQMDGIAGMIPLQIFKVDKDRLPFGYQRKDIVFIVKSEEHKISPSQDWTVEITGQMALLNINPNDKGLQGKDHTYITREKKKPEEGKELSTGGLSFIISFEGFHTVAYPDGFYTDGPNKGKPKYTVGYGTQIWNGKRVTAKYPDPSQVTETAARENMLAHLEKQVYPEIEKHVSVDLSQPQFDALASYIYNSGPANTVIGTQFIRKLNNGDYFGASQEIDIISVDQGNGTYKVYEGLMTRRAKEQRLFNGHSDGYSANYSDKWNTCNGCPRGRNETANNAYNFVGGKAGPFTSKKYY